LAQLYHFMRSLRNNEIPRNAGKVQMLALFENAGRFIGGLVDKLVNTPVPHFGDIHCSGAVDRDAMGSIELAKALTMRP
jgi:hypothetical protein